MHCTRLAFLLLLICYAAFPIDGKVRYDNYEVYRLFPETEEQLQLIKEVADNFKLLDFWIPPSQVRRHVDVMVPPNQLEIINQFINSTLRVQILIPNVQLLINKQTDEHNRAASNTTNDFDYTRYHTLPEIEQWINDFTTEYSSIATQEDVSTSAEGRPIKAIRLSVDQQAGKPVAYIQGGIHAREWISPATMMFLTYKLVNDYNVDHIVTKMLDNLDWYIVPVLNPDGYEYTWTNDRFWRKNRRRAEGVKCTGTDLNRNYGYKWGGTGASSDPCSSLYRGPSPISEPELSGLTQFLLKKRQTNGVVLHMDFHSYGQYWLYPWGYTSSRKEPQPDKAKQRALALEAQAAILATHGRKYFVGESGPDLYPASGASEDWGYGSLGAKYTYIVELRDQGKYGFLLPEREIAPTTEEIYAAMKVVGAKLVEEM